MKGKRVSKENVPMAFLTSTTGALSRSTLSGSAILCIETPASDSHCTGKGAFCAAGGVCKVMNCTVGDNTTCNDGNSCTNETCVAKQGCVTTPVKAGAECADERGGERRLWQT